MYLFFKLALRNLVRNKTRSFLNIFMIIGAFSTIVIFRGFANYMLDSVENGLVEMGHIQIATPAVWNNEFPKIKKQAYIEDSNGLLDQIKSIQNVRSASGRIEFFSVLMNSEKSLNIRAFAFDPNAEPQIEKSLLFVEGQNINAESFDVLIGSGIKKSLNLHLGQTITLLSQTLEGTLSSVDLEIRGVVSTGFADSDNSTVYVPLKVGQKIIGTQSIERIVITLNKKSPIDEIMQSVNHILKKYPHLQAKSWLETEKLYGQLKRFYAVQNSLVEIVLGILVFFGILNTLGFSIYERTKELGTLRALGETVGNVFFLLVFEGVLLALIGGLVAAPLSLILSYSISAMDIQLIMPGASLTMPLQINPFTKDFLDALLTIVYACLFSVFWPALQISRISIVEALRST